MFSMTHTNASDGCDINISMSFDDTDVTLEKMFAYFMSMMSKIGYNDGSWNRIVDDLNEWRNDYGIENGDWVGEYRSEVMYS